jgi:hypothetical protein
MVRHRVRPLHPTVRVACSRSSGPRSCRRHESHYTAVERSDTAGTPRNQNASRRDASMQWERCRTLKPLAGIPSGCASFGASLSMSWSPKSDHTPRHSGAVSIGVSSHPGDSMFCAPTKCSKKPKQSIHNTLIEILTIHTKPFQLLYTIKLTMNRHEPDS